MTIGMDNAIVLLKADITNKKLLEEKEIDAIVNAANHTLMGSKQGVDGAIHGVLENLNKTTINELHTDDLENRQRCKRGQAVTTSTGEGDDKLCKYIIHTVGAKYDGNGKICSSSRIQILEHCYRSVIEEVKIHPDIRNIAVPVIGAGDYGFPFKLAVEIAVCSLNNALLEWKQKEPELFNMSKLKMVYIFVYHPTPAKADEYFQTANWVMQEYQSLLMENRKITYLSSWQAHLSYLKEIRSYDRQRGYFAIARRVREALMILRILFLPIMFLKDFFGGKDWERRREFVERLVGWKIVIPLVTIIFLNWIQNKWILLALLLLTVYSLEDTLTYLLILLLMSDIQRPSANIIRSLILLFMNYIEAALDLSVWYAAMSVGVIGKKMVRL